ncbi:hypothetical protein N431DRAFT_435749 [Stipitochalara longipes BDJ]|nr:hypothetical protein N431DRAFT_435749 [Stipitochalara longipes BDJ]
MVSNTVVVPVAVLASICICMFAFICWWFPRTWAKGIALDKREYRENAERRQRDLELATSETAIGEHTDIRTSEPEGYAHKQEGVLAGESTGAQAVRVQAGESEAAGSTIKGG